MSRHLSVESKALINFSTPYFLFVVYLIQLLSEEFYLTFKTFKTKVKYQNGYVLLVLAMTSHLFEVQFDTTNLLSSKSLTGRFRIDSVKLTYV